MKSNADDADFFATPLNDDALFVESLKTWLLAGVDVSNHDGRLGHAKIWNQPSNLVVKLVVSDSLQKVTLSFKKGVI